MFSHEYVFIKMNNKQKMHFRTKIQEIAFCMCNKIIIFS